MIPDVWGGGLSVFLPQVTDVPDAAPPAAAEPSEGIVGALMMVMNKRSKVIHSSGEFCSDLNSVEDAGKQKLTPEFPPSFFFPEESDDDGGDDDDDDDEWDD